MEEHISNKSLGHLSYLKLLSNIYIFNFGYPSNLMSK